MKQFIAVLVALLVLVQAKPTFNIIALEEGKPNGDILYQGSPPEAYNCGPYFWQTNYLTLPVDGSEFPKKIGYIKVRSLTDSTDAKAYIVEGGIGHKKVELEFDGNSVSGYKYEFDIRSEK